MCSDPQDFFNKETGEVKQGACRRCDECIATRRHGWVARAMAEKAGWPHTLVVALTYSDATQQGRDGARMFCYADVRLFLARLRDAAWQVSKKAGAPRPVIRFLCAGEQGDRNGRCHWHMVLYSDIDLTGLGVVEGLLDRRKVVLCDKSQMMTVGKRKRRLDWSLWPLGYVTFQEADQGGMNYVLSYCLKDQFTEEKSRHTMREAKAENFATGLFRMSKRPPIGEDFIMRKLEALDAVGAVLPSMNIMVPGFRGYWHPSGSLREKLLWGLVALNQRVFWATGRSAPQWPSLLASCADSENDMGVLAYEPEDTQTPLIASIRDRARPQPEEDDWVERDKRPARVWYPSVEDTVYVEVPRPQSYRDVPGAETPPGFADRKAGGATKRKIPYREENGAG